VMYLEAESSLRATASVEAESSLSNRCIYIYIEAYH
jgi:hypothetical protein